MSGNIPYNHAEKQHQILNIRIVPPPGFLQHRNAFVTFSTLPNETKAVSLLTQIYGAYLFPSGDAPKYLTGFGVISGIH